MILITGATGMLGAQLALHLLENGDCVRAISRTSASADKTKALFTLYQKEHLFDKIQWFIADILDIPSLYPAFEGIEQVYHCAASVSFNPDDEELLRKTNIEGTANIVNLCLSQGIKKLGYVSSIAALGDPIAGAIINEETEWNPEIQHSDYAISKHGAEMEIWRGHQEGLNVFVVSPGVIIGPATTKEGWKAGSPEIFNRVANGLRYYTNGTTGFISVGDVVKILRTIMNSEINGDRFILVAEMKCFRDILWQIAKALQVNEPSISAGRNFTSIAWRLDWLASLFGKKRTLSRLMAKSLHSRQIISNEKTGMTLHYDFEDLDSAINETAKFYPK